MASELFANRTSLAQAKHESGYENYSNYINRVGARLKIPANANQSGRDFKSHSDFVGRSLQLTPSIQCFFQILVLYYNPVQNLCTNIIE